MPEPWAEKTAWKASLGTKDPSAAKRRYIGKLHACQRDFDLAEMRRERSHRDSLSDDEIEALAGWYRDESLPADREFWEVGHRQDEAFFEQVRSQLQRAGAEPQSPFAAFKGNGLSDRQLQHKAETAEVLIAGMRWALARGDTSLIEGEVDDVLEVHGISLPRDGVSYRRLALAFLEAQLESAQGVARRLDGEVVRAPAIPSPRGDGTVGESRVAAGGPRLREAFERWKQLQNPGQGSALEFERGQAVRPA